MLFSFSYARLDLLKKILPSYQVIVIVIVIVTALYDGVGSSYDCLTRDLRPSLSTAAARSTRPGGDCVYHALCVWGSQ